MWAPRAVITRNLELDFISGVLSEPADGGSEFGDGDSSMPNAAISTTPLLL